MTASTDAPGTPDLQALTVKMAADRSLMAWISTGLSMISFGFALYKILQGYQVQTGGLPQPNTARNVGMFLLASGTLGIVMGTVSYWHTLRELRPLRHFRFAQPVTVMAVLMGALGIVLSIVIATRMY
jgi:putative membrane protein